MKRKAAVMVLAFLVATSVIAPFASTLAVAWDITPPVTFTTDSGLNVTIDDSAETTWTNSEIFPDTETVNVTGNGTVSAPGAGNITIQDLQGTYTNATDIDATGTTITINPDDKPAAEVNGDTDTLNFTTPSVDDGNVDFVYSGASGTSTITIHGLPANEELAAVEASTGNILDKDISSGTGVATFAGMTNSEHNVEINSTTVGAPNINASSASPTGPQNDTPTELSVEVDDPDFDTSAGDNVTVKFYLNDTLQGTHYITSKSTVTQSISVGGGNYHWNVTAEDGSGLTDEAGDFEFSTPTVIKIFNETQPTQKLSQRVNVTLFPDSDNVYRLSTTNGELDINSTLLQNEVEEDIILVAKSGEETGAPKEFFERHIVIEDIAEQPRIYMLTSPPNSTWDERVENRFTLDDATGSYPPSTTQLFIKKPINRDFDGDGTNETKFETVAADEFGQNGWLTHLERDQRYRLEVVNVDGDRRVLGSYTPRLNETVPLDVKKLNINPDANLPYKWEANYTNNTDINTNPQIHFKFNDTDEQTTDLRLRIYPRGNDTEAAEVVNRSFAGPHGEFSFTHTLNSSSVDTNYVVEWTATRNGEEISGKRIVGPKDTVIPALDPFWKKTISLGFIIILGGLFSTRNSEMGAIVMSFTGGIFWFFGWLPTAIGGGIVFLAMAIAVMFYIRSERSGI